MRVWIALSTVIASLTCFDLLAIYLISILQIPSQFYVPVFGMEVPQADFALVILILFPVSIMEIFFISHVIDWERVWKW